MTPEERKEIIDVIKEAGVDWKAVFNQSIELNTKSTEAIALVKERTKGLSVSLEQIKNRLPKRYSIFIWPVVVLILAFLIVHFGGCLQYKDLITFGTCPIK